MSCGWVNLKHNAKSIVSLMKAWLWQQLSPFGDLFSQFTDSLNHEKPLHGNNICSCTLNEIMKTLSNPRIVSSKSKHMKTKTLSEPWCSYISVNSVHMESVNMSMIDQRMLDYEWGVRLIWWTCRSSKFPQLARLCFWARTN